MTRPSFGTCPTCHRPSRTDRYGYPRWHRKRVIYNDGTRMLIVTCTGGMCPEYKAWFDARRAAA
jgi:hypothetical protein